MKKLIIIRPDCRELANHLWNYLSIYAYGIETGAHVLNPSFFKWHRYFDLNKKETFITKMMPFFSIFKWIWGAFLSLYGSYLIRTRMPCVLLTLSELMYLPPTRPLADNKNICDAIYFIGWLFRNPVGLERYRNEIVSAFMPKESILKKIEGILVQLKGKRLIGVQIRQKPYKGFEDENFLVSVTRVRHIVDEYLREKKLNAKDVALVIVSDRNTCLTAFADLATHISCDNDATNLFLLSKCSAIIGTNSTFSNLAAWFGNVPHIVESNEPMDWEYYRNATAYFENKYATFAF